MTGISRVALDRDAAGAENPAVRGEAAALSRRAVGDEGDVRPGDPAGRQVPAGTCLAGSDRDLACRRVRIRARNDE